MAKKFAYQEEGNPILSILYVVAVAALVVALVFMYRNWQQKKKDFNALVRQVSATETTMDIETRKGKSADEEVREDAENGEDREAVTESQVSESQAAETATEEPAAEKAEAEKPAEKEPEAEKPGENAS